MYYPMLTDFEWGIAGIIFIIIIVVALRSGKKKSVNEWDTPEWQEKWKKEAEEREKEERERLILSNILVTEEQFNALSEVSVKIQKVVNRLCYDEGFIRFIHQKDERTKILYDGDDMYLHYKHEPLYDVLWAFDRLGCLCDHNADYSEMRKRCRIDFETKEGQCLLIISRVMNGIDSESPYAYFDYQRTVGDAESLFYKCRDVLDNSPFDTFVHYNPVVGQENYKVCDWIGGYSQDDKLLYRSLMYRLAVAVAEILGIEKPSESEWISDNIGNASDIAILEKANDRYEVPLYKPSTTSFDDEDDDEDDYDEDEEDDFESSFTEDTEITYSFLGSDAPQDSFVMELSEKDADRLKEADENGEFLDSDYISDNLKSIHRKILDAIREDLESKSDDPHDGMKEVHHPPAYHAWEKVHDSHQDLLLSFDENVVEYVVDLFC